jgi:hypothetical protein
MPNPEVEYLYRPVLVWLAKFSDGRATEPSRRETVEEAETD